MLHPITHTALTTATWNLSSGRNNRIAAPIRASRTAGTARMRRGGGAARARRDCSRGARVASVLPHWEGERLGHVYSIRAILSAEICWPAAASRGCRDCSHVLVVRAYRYRTGGSQSSLPVGSIAMQHIARGVFGETLAPRASVSHYSQRASLASGTVNSSSQYASSCLYSGSAPKFGPAGSDSPANSGPKSAGLAVGEFRPVRPDLAHCVCCGLRSHACAAAASGQK